MTDWIVSHPYAAGSVGVLILFAVICAFVCMDKLRDWLDGKKAAPSKDSGALEGANPTVRMPRFR